MKIYGLFLTIALSLSTPSLAGQGQTARTEKPSKKSEKTPTYSLITYVGLIGVGMAFAFETSPNRSIELIGGLESAIFAGATYTQVRYKMFFGDSFNVAPGIGYFEASGYNETHNVAAVSLSLALANEWRFEDGFILGGDWLSVTKSINSSRGFLGLPKIRLGWLF